MKILISAFEPFGASRRNSSLDTLLSLPRSIGRAEIKTITLPVVYGLSSQVLCSAIDAIRPDAVICLGQAAGRGRITPEFAALNVMHSDEADNLGQIFHMTPIIEGASAAHISALFPDKLAAHLTLRSIPASLSFTAGTFVCNDLFYRTLTHCAPLGIPTGFIHLPLSYEIASAECRAGSVLTLPQSVLTEGVALAAEFTVSELGGI